MPCAWLFAAIIRNVPNRRTSRCCNTDVDGDGCDSNGVGDIGDIGGDEGDWKTPVNRWATSQRAR